VVWLGFLGDGPKKKIDDGDMTLIFALNTGKELYLASDGIGIPRKMEGKTEFNIIEKFMKVNNNVELLFSGILELAQEYFHGVQQELWGVGCKDNEWSSFEIAKRLEKFIAPTYERLERMYSDRIYTPEILKEYGSISAFLRKDWPLEIFICGMDKDANGTLSNPQIHILNNNQKYISFKFKGKIALSGAPNVLKVAMPIFNENRFLNLFDSTHDIKNEICSGYSELIQKLKSECPNDMKVCIGGPIHIARISKEGYELLR